MLSKCANPSCSKAFQYLRDGRLFQMETGLGGPASVEKKRAHKIEYFWLCSTCCGDLTLTYLPGKGVVTVPLRQARSAAAS
jgi:hypothetical protein